MRNFWKLRQPDVRRIVLVESGPRHLLEGAIPVLRRLYGDSIPIDLVTCFAGSPAGFTAGNGRVYQVADHQGRAGRKRLYRELCALAPDALVMVCADVPIMTKWKWALAWNLPAKVLILNENSDFFWFDRAHWRVILHFIAFRAGLTGGGMVRTIADFALFPFTLGYLLLYAGWVHARRKVRLAMRGGV